jgi:tetratricopeptide (TPR) repeat protein
VIFKKLWSLLLLISLSASLWAGPLRRVGVLDFTNLTGSSANDWVCEAFSSAISAKLSRVVELSVLERQILNQLDGVARLSGKKILDGDAKELAKLAGLDFLVIGSVQSSGELDKKNIPLRVHARLVDTQRGIIHQAVLVDGQMENIFDLQFRLAKQFIDLARIDVSIAELNAMKSEATLNLEAYRLYNLGMLAKNKKQFAPAIKYFEQAMSKHPGILYADAHYEIGQVYLALGKKDELLVRFRSDVAKLAPVYYDLGVAYREAGEFDKAIEAFKTFVDSTDKSPVLWEMQVEDQPFQLFCSKENQHAVMVQGKRLQGVNTATGQVLWQKEQSAQENKQYKIINSTLLIQSGRQTQRIDLDSGEILADNQTSAEPLNNVDTNDNEIYIAMSETHLEVKNKNETLWDYQAKESEQILGHNNQALFIKNGRHQLRAVRIQKGRAPGQLEGLLELSKCLSQLNRTAEAMEVARYIIDHVDDQNENALRQVGK